MLHRAARCRLGLGCCCWPSSATRPPILVGAAHWALDKYWEYDTPIPGNLVKTFGEPPTRPRASCAPTATSRRTATRIRWSSPARCSSPRSRARAAVCDLVLHLLLVLGEQRDHSPQWAHREQRSGASALAPALHLRAARRAPPASRRVHVALLRHQRSHELDHGHVRRVAARREGGEGRPRRRPTRPRRAAEARRGRNGRRRRHDPASAAPPGNRGRRAVAPAARAPWIGGLSCARTASPSGTRACGWSSARSFRLPPPGTSPT